MGNYHNVYFVYGALVYQKLLQITMGYTSHKLLVTFELFIYFQLLHLLIIKCIKKVIELINCEPHLDVYKRVFFAILKKHLKQINIK